MITQRFESTKGFAKGQNNRVYSRLSKNLCGFKDQVRAHQSGEKIGLNVVPATKYPEQFLTPRTDPKSLKPGACSNVGIKWSGFTGTQLLGAGLLQAPLIFTD